MKQFIVLVGVSHSGKSTYARKLAKNSNYLIINTDHIRRKFFTSLTLNEIEYLEQKYIEGAKAYGFEKGKNIIVDSCNITPASRWFVLRGCPKDYEKIAIFFDIPKEVLIERCNRNKRLKWSVIENMLNYVDVSTLKEEFGKVETGR